MEIKKRNIKKKIFLLNKEAVQIKDNILTNISSFIDFNIYFPYLDFDIIFISGVVSTNFINSS